jgi:hypothetical protein
MRLHKERKVLTEWDIESVRQAWPSLSQDLMSPSKFVGTDEAVYAANTIILSSGYGHLPKGIGRVCRIAKTRGVE